MVIPGWTEIIRPTEVMALCLSSEVLLIHPNLFFPLLLHDFLWDLPNIQANQGSLFLTLLIFLVVMPLLDSIMGVFKV